MIELPIAAKFTGCDLWQTVSSKTLRKAGHKVLAIGRPIFSLLLKLHDAAADEPVPQGQRHIDGFGGKVLGLLVEVDDGGDQRVKVSGGGGLR